jgi:putative tryptophan/tyrosine transport system substrate-binding protein
MERRAFISGITGGLLAAPLAVEAQQAGKVARIGYLANHVASSPHLPEAFRQGLRDLGYVEGRNVVIEYRDAEGKLERLRALAAELVALKVDVMVSSAYPGTLAAKNATNTIPIIMVGVADPVRMGLIASLVRPGGNITGLTLLAGTEIVGKHLELLKAAVPNLSRVAVLWNPANPMHVLRLREVEVAGRSLRVQLQILKAQGPEEFDSAFAAMTRERAGALYVVGDPMLSQHRRRLAELAAKSRLPAVYELKDHAEAGGLVAYGPSLLDMYRRAATYVDKILKGANPADLPVEQPTKFELVINLKTAKALGLIIPQSLLLQADQVIE